MAEYAGGPRAFKYGTTKRYVLGLEAVLPTGEIIRTGGKTVKNVVGYDLTQLLVGSEGTLAIITKIISAADPEAAGRGARCARRSRSIDGGGAGGERGWCDRARRAGDARTDRRRVARRGLGATWADALAPAGTEALLLIEVDGLLPSIEEQASRVEEACRASGRARSAARARRRASGRAVAGAARAVPGAQDDRPAEVQPRLVVPEGPGAGAVRAGRSAPAESGLRIPAFGHAGDGNIHVNVMVRTRTTRSSSPRARGGARAVRGRHRARGLISGEHGIGFTKVAVRRLQLSPTEIALMRRLKAGLRSAGILNPGKMFPRMDSRPPAA